MEIALIQYFTNHGYEVWITDTIEIGSGLGDVFDTHGEALEYARDHQVEIVDVSHIEISYQEGQELRNFLGNYIEISENGTITSIK